jgi:AraC-like DNA-binding protein
MTGRLQVGTDLSARSSQAACTEDENLALCDGVCLTMSVTHSISSGSQDPHVLLNDTALDLDGKSLADFSQSHTRDTYDGQNHALQPDWYALKFPEPLAFNCVEMTMGFPYRDGGWWTSLGVETQRSAEAPWERVSHFNITPPYNFHDTRARRRPYETYALTFDEVTAQSLRVIGAPGGVAEFTSLGRLAVYRRDLSRWNPACLPTPPEPYFFRLIYPRTIFQLSDSLVRLTGLRIRFPLMEFYLDEPSQLRLWETIRHNYEGAPELWFLIGETIGWDFWNRHDDVQIVGDAPLDQPHVRVSFHDSVGMAVAPVKVEGEILGEMTTHPALILPDLDWSWHQRFASEHNIPWRAYQAAIERSPQMTRDQLQGAASLLGMISNIIAGLAHRNLHLERELTAVLDMSDDRSRSHRAITRHAIDFMVANLETAIRVPDIARAVALSPAYFTTVFTEQTGHSPVQFLTDLRIQRAKEYLAEGRMSVMDVCVALGYSPSYFNRLFRKRVGCPPGQFARRFSPSP